MAVPRTRLCMHTVSIYLIAELRRMSSLKMKMGWGYLCSLSMTCLACIWNAICVKNRNKSRGHSCACEVVECRLKNSL